MKYTKRKNKEELISNLKQVYVVSPEPLYKVLETKRIKLHLSKRAFASVLGVTPTFYCYFSKGKKPQLPLNATKKAYALGIPADILLGVYEKHKELL